MKRLVLGLAAALLLLGGAAAGYVFYKKHQGRDVRGSSTVEFVPTEPPPRLPPPPRKKKPGSRVPAKLTRVDWPTYGYDPRRLRYLPSRLKPPYRAEWKFRARHLVEFPPVVAYGRVYVANNPGTLFAIDARTGKLAWHYSARRCAASSPAVADGLVYQTFLNKPPCNAKNGSGLDGEIVAFDARKGRIRWRRTIGPSESSPLVANGLVYVGDWRGVVYALSARTGKERWRFQTGGEVKGAVALSGRRLYVGSYDHHVYALAARTGKLIWRADAQSRLGSRGTFYSTPAAAYGRVYIGSTDGKVYSFGAASGELRWSQSTGGYVYASPAIWNRRVLVGSYSGTFYSLDAATGDVQWQFRADGRISGSATVLGDLVYFSTLSGRTYALEARTGKRVWSFPDGKYSPLVAGPERVYLVGFTKVYGMVPR